MLTLIYYLKSVMTEICWRNYVIVCRSIFVRLNIAAEKSVTNATRLIIYCFHPFIKTIGYELKRQLSPGHKRWNYIHCEAARIQSPNQITLY